MEGACVTRLGRDVGDQAWPGIPMIAGDAVARVPAGDCGHKQAEVEGLHRRVRSRVSQTIAKVSTGTSTTTTTAALPSPLSTSRVGVGRGRSRVGLLMWLCSAEYLDHDGAGAPRRLMSIDQPLTKCSRRVTDCTVTGWMA
jgi:hypothetical protein